MAIECQLTHFPFHFDEAKYTPTFGSQTTARILMGWAKAARRLGFTWHPKAPHPVTSGSF